MTHKYDYVALKAEFVQAQPEISIRALADRHGMAYNSLNVQCLKGNWREDRETFQKALARKELSLVTTALATKKATIVADALDVIHAAVFKMASDMQDRWVTDPTNPNTRVYAPGIIITPDSLAKLLDRLLTLTGSPNAITESRNFGPESGTVLPPDIARLIAEVAGSRSADARPVGRSALPGAKPARPD